jgi:hypothetical protein
MPHWVVMEPTSKIIHMAAKSSQMTDHLGGRSAEQRIPVPHCPKVGDRPSGAVFAVPKSSKPSYAAHRNEVVLAYAFEYACALNNIDHRLTKPKHRWTTDVIDKYFLAGSKLFSSRAWVTARRRAEREARALPSRSAG